MLWETVKLALSSIRRNSLRSVLTLLGIVIGVAAVIAMVTLGSGASDKVRENLSRLGSNMLIVRPGQGTFGPGGSTDARAFDERDVAALKASLSGIRGVAPTAQKQVKAVFGALNYDTTVTGTTSDWFIVQDWVIADGRTFTEGEIRSGTSVCVIGATIVRELFEGGMSKAIASISEQDVHLTVRREHLSDAEAARVKSLLSQVESILSSARARRHAESKVLPATHFVGCAFCDLDGELPDGPLGSA